MTLCVIASKSLIPPKNLSSLYYFCSLNIDFSFKVRFIFVSSLAQHFHCSSELNNHSFKPAGDVGSNGTVTIRDCKIKSSYGLYQNLILKTATENPGVFRDIHWVVPDYFNALVIDSDLFLSVVNSIKNRPRMVLKIFRWAEGQKGFKHSEFVFCSVLEVLVQNGFMRSAYWVMERVINANMHSIVNVLTDGYLGIEVTCKVLDLLLWLYSKKSDVERCLWVFDKMVRNGFLPDVKNCNRILRLLRDRDLVGAGPITGDAEEGLPSNDVTFNVLINGLSKKGMLVEALGLGEEMILRGALPTVSTYNAFMHGYCKQGRDRESTDGKNVFNNEMQGLEPDRIAYTTCIAGELKLGDSYAAFKLQEEMLAKGFPPDVITYNVFVDGISKLGDLEQACELLQKMIQDGVVPDQVTYTSIIHAHLELGTLEKQRVVS
ncbi:UNVERIFIED_CONTAM: Pentatricopeptide repeat-containing protein, mitochondrial [Sesamum radiatum]|uniref:Pentatricopeptide repeat-containing protein, mitochondrial n=1 Tax=Sesamum radiatum TaxID=300843 RepID=A0AAW2TWH4_SESRA